MENDVLVAITVSRDKGEIVYKVDCSSDLANDELEYYLEEIIKGICQWKPGICEETIHSFRGTIGKRQPKKKHAARQKGARAKGSSYGNSIALPSRSRSN